jgi:P-type Mg2+ transporter
MTLMPQSPTMGLSWSDAHARLRQDGPNTVGETNRLPGLSAFFSRFRNPLVIILLLAAALSAFVGDIVSFVIIVSIVVLSIVLDFVTTYRSEAAAEDLKRQVRVTARVYRSGHAVDVPISDIVRGDVAVLTPGKLIPADGTITQSKDLYVNESALTGESFPSSHTTGDLVRMGTSVTSGEGLLLVTATGSSTEFAHIAGGLQKSGSLTEFEREIRQFSGLIIRITFVLVLVIFAINALLKHNILESLLFSLALAVGLTPELLPLIISLNLTKGSLAMARKGVIVKRLSAIQDFGSMDVFCTDKTGTLTEDRIALVKYVDGLGRTSETVLEYAYLSSLYSARLENPLDRAVKAYRQFDERGWKRIDDIPFSFERKRESVVVSGGTRGKLLITKGAPEEVLSLCTSYHDGRALNSTLLPKIQAEYEQLSRDGFRVLAVATKKVTKTSGYEPADEAGLVLEGFVAFLDPAKKSVTATLRKLVEYGVAVKIVSGDNALVNRRIADEIRLPVAGILTGDEIAGKSTAQLARLVESTTIFARVTPEQKQQVIRALQHNGHVVGYMGDGINDAPSLAAADIGISVNNAVDVAKDTADLILLHKSLSELVEGVIEGRRTFANTLKYMMMALSSNFGNMFTMAGASLFLPFLPMKATQILLNNLLYDTSQFGIPTDTVDPEQLKAPHKLSIANIRKFMWVFGPLSSVFDLFTFGLLVVVFHLGEKGFQTGWFLESILTQILVIYLIRTRLRLRDSVHPSLPLVLSTMAALVVALAVVLLPLGSFFGFTLLAPLQIWAISAIVLIYLLATNVIKRAFYLRVQF